MKKFALIALLALAAKGVYAQERLAPAAFQEALKNPGAQLIDVRTPEEFAKGHLPGAVNIDWLQDNYLERISGSDKARPVLLYCAVGGRSEEAREAMQAAGFKNVADLDGGFLKWRSLQLPITTAK